MMDRRNSDLATPPTPLFRMMKLTRRLFLQHARLFSFIVRLKTYYFMIYEGRDGEMNRLIPVLFFYWIFALLECSLNGRHLALDFVTSENSTRLSFFVRNKHMEFRQHFLIWKGFDVCIWFFAKMFMRLYLYLDFCVNFIV